MTYISKKSIVYIAALYVDHRYCVGHGEAMQDTIAHVIMRGLAAKVKDDLAGYLSCNILVNKNKTKVWLGQPL
jgi:hypothetical protein